MNIVLTALSALLGALLFLRLRIPAGAMIGAVCGTVLFSALTGCADMPYTAKFFAQVLAGAFIGCSMEREDFAALRGVWRPALVVLSSYLVLNLLTGFLLWRLAGLDLITALFCGVPGGMSDVPLIASDLGAELSAVVVLQFVRLCAGLTVFPLLVARIPQEQEPTAPTGKEKKQKAPPLPAILLLLLLASLAAMLGRNLGVPAGPLLFSIFTSLFFKLFFLPVTLPRRLKRFAQVLSGAYIGCSVTVESLRQIPHLLLPAALIVLLYLANAFFISRVLHRRFSVPRREAMLMLTPAGASDMALISADLGVQSPSLLVVQLFRMLAASALFPQICYRLALWIGG